MCMKIDYQILINYLTVINSYKAPNFNQWSDVLLKKSLANWCSVTSD